MTSSRRSSPVAALMIRTSRSWTSRMTWVRAWVRPTPMWRSRPATRRVTVPGASILSNRTRWWLSVLRSAVPRAALGRAPYGVVGPGVLLHAVEPVQLVLAVVATAAAAGEPGGVDHRVVGEHGRRIAVSV